MRAFLARDTQKYDLIVFGLLDSHVLLSSRSNLRLDSFVFRARASPWRASTWHRRA